MDLNTLLAELNDQEDEAGQLAAVEALGTMAADDQVVEALCTAAVSSAAAKVRERILDALHERPQAAARLFVRAARKENEPGRRRLALVNLSLMGCDTPDAREVALQGLQDPYPDIQYAAALSAGYFDDPPFLGALARYLEANRYAVACAGIQRQIFRQGAARQTAGKHGDAPQPVLNG